MFTADPCVYMYVQIGSLSKTLKSQAGRGLPQAATVPTLLLNRQPRHAPFGSRSPVVLWNNGRADCQLALGGVPPRAAPGRVHLTRQVQQQLAGEWEHRKRGERAERTGFGAAIRGEQQL